MTTTEKMTRDLQTMVSRYPPDRNTWRPLAVGRVLPGNQFVVQDWEGECFVVTVQKAVPEVKEASTRPSRTHSNA